MKKMISRRNFLTAAGVVAAAGVPVSYTHLDVYKRQVVISAALAAGLLAGCGAASSTASSAASSEAVSSVADVYKRQMLNIPISRRSRK